MCTSSGDCCSDYASVCGGGGGGGGANSCVGNCNGQAPGGCYCDTACTGAGDCCADYANACGGGGGGSGSLCGKNPAATCKSMCGGAGKGSCYCDDFCQTAGDCCPDFAACGCF
jgi:hypothetical protein